MNNKFNFNEKKIYDYSKLKKLIEEKYGKQFVLAHKFGTTIQTINNKLNNVSRFTYEEIEFLINDLDIKDNEIREIFFKLK